MTMDAVDIAFIKMYLILQPQNYGTIFYPSFMLKTRSGMLKNLPEIHNVRLYLKTVH